MLPVPAIFLSTILLVFMRDFWALSRFSLNFPFNVDIAPYNSKQNNQYYFFFQGATHKINVKGLGEEETAIIPSLLYKLYMKESTEVHKVFIWISAHGAYLIFGLLGGVAYSKGKIMQGRALIKFSLFLPQRHYFES